MVQTRPSQGSATRLPLVVGDRDCVLYHAQRRLSQQTHSHLGEVFGGVGTVARDEIGESDAPAHSSSVVTAPVPCSVRGSDTNRAVPGNGSWRADAPPAACPQEADRDAVSSDAFGIACPYASADTRGVRQAAVTHNSSYLRIA